MNDERFMRPVLPEAVSDDRWIVAPGPVAVDTKRKIATAPIGENAQATARRLYVLGRAMYSPDDPVEQTNLYRIKAALEDVRVASRFQRSGVNIDARGDVPTLDDIAKHPANSVERAIDMIRGTATTRGYHGSSGAVASYQLFRDDGSLGYREQNAYSAAVEMWGRPGMSKRRRDQLAMMILDPPVQSVPVPVPVMPSLVDDLPAEYGTIDRRRVITVSDTFEICDHVSPAAEHHRRATFRPFGARDSGIIPDAWHRWVEDRAVFRRRRRTASIVIDCSGSMEWDWAELERLIKIAPAAVIGAYQGTFIDGRDHDDTMTYGRLCIIANHGRIAPYGTSTTEPDRCGENNVDYESLQWLAKQPRPRFWLSDGYVAGGRYTARDCTELCGAEHITRVDTIEALLKVIH